MPSILLWLCKNVSILGTHLQFSWGSSWALQKRPHYFCDLFTTNFAPKQQLCPLNQLKNKSSPSAFIVVQSECTQLLFLCCDTWNKFKLLPQYLLLNFVALTFAFTKPLLMVFVLEFKKINTNLSLLCENTDQEEILLNFSPSEKSPPFQRCFCCVTQRDIR